MWDLIKFILSEPPKWLVNCYKIFIKNPCKYLSIGLSGCAFIIATAFFLKVEDIRYIMFLHQNKDYIKSSRNGDIEDIIDLALNQCGDGTTITRSVVGRRYYTAIDKSLEIDIALSCDEKNANLIKDKKDRTNCTVDARWLNPFYREEHNIKTDDFESDFLKIDDQTFSFSEFKPIWINFRQENKELTREGNYIKIVYPQVYDILKKMKPNIRKIGIVKVRDPDFKNVIYLFTLSFWENAEKKCVDNEGSEDQILTRIARTQKNLLIR